ncbi:helix-turn-helix domain-containing protein [Streptomyces cellostaticus]|uniref:helix-turn-helix domain-containing protein n=1 Tax=Streptomyces cellostaticus TaxID=67285 RepID=UPI002025B6FD|nr:helix-turn-helix domain-containing protein [Streptomyces cellostaticus]
MSSDNRDPKELGSFLMARRADLEPAQVGLPDTGAPRKVAGLRREEVAELAAISTDYYTRIEQGRMRASAPALEAIARALRLTDDQRTYLYDLVGRAPVDSPARPDRVISMHTRRLLDQLTESPAVVLSDTMDVLGWNRLAAALLVDFGQIPEEDRNYVWLLFNHPALRALYDDWESGAHACVAYLRMHTARCPDDPRLHDLLARMASHSDFDRWWKARDVAVQGTGNKVFHHPVVGTLTLDWATLTSSAVPDQHVVMWTAEPGSSSEKGLRILAAVPEEAGRSHSSS